MAPIKEWFGAYNIIYKWFRERYGLTALEEYWRFIAESCFNETVEQFKRFGLEGIHRYFCETFDKDGGEYISAMEKGLLTFEVTKCPDYEFMKSAANLNFKPIEDYCMHHKVMNTVLAEKAGYSFSMCECSHDGRCKWVFEEKEKQDKGGDGVDGT